jgi:hypothetical protein
MKKGSFVRAGLFSLIAAGLSACGDAGSEAKVSALELEDVAAYWAVRGKDRDENNYIHPVVRFRIKNTGATEVGYIQSMAVFKMEAFPDEPWGNDFLYSISETPLAPGSRSDVLTMRSDTNFVSKDAPEQMFQNEKWEEISVSVFLRAGPSAWKPVLALQVPSRLAPRGREVPGAESALSPEAACSTS